MWIEKAHQKNWEEIKKFFSLDCKPPHLKLYKYFETVSREFRSDVANFLGLHQTTISVQPRQDIYELLLPKTEMDAFNYRLFAQDRNLVVIGGIGISRSFLKNKWEARIVDKKELIHSALSLLSPFYSMHTDIAITDPSKSYYKSYEEDIAWALLKRMEDGNDKVTDLRSRITREKILYPSMNFVKDSMSMTEAVLKETDTVRKPLEAFRKFNELLEPKLPMPFEINVERDYKNFLELNCSYVRRLEDEWEYFKPKYI